MTLQFDSTRKHECEHCNKCFPSCIIQINVKDTGDQKRWCFNCGACVDTCADVQTVHNDNTKPPLLQIKKGTGKLPTSVFISAVVFVIASIVLSYGIMTHRDIEVSVTSERAGGYMYAKNSKGEVELRYDIKIHNKDNKPHKLNIEVSGLPAGSYIVEKQQQEAGMGESVTTHLIVTIHDPAFVAHKTKDFTVKVSDPDNPKFSAADKGVVVVP